MEYADVLFLISSKGVPRHCTTSVNRGDTVKQIPREDGERASSVAAARTIVPHSDVRDYLLQHRLSLRELLVLRLCSL